MIFFLNHYIKFINLCHLALQQKFVILNNNINMYLFYYLLLLLN